MSVRVQRNSLSIKNENVTRRLHFHSKVSIFKNDWCFRNVSTIELDCSCSIRCNVDVDKYHCVTSWRGDDARFIVVVFNILFLFNVLICLTEIRNDTECNDGSFVQMQKVLITFNWCLFCKTMFPNICNIFANDLSSHCVSRIVTHERLFCFARNITTCKTCVRLTSKICLIKSISRPPTVVCVTTHKLFYSFQQK